MPVYKSEEKTKTGRSWYFKTQYDNYYEKGLTMCSKKYDTMAEAKEAEINFLIYAEKMKSIPVKMTFQELFDAFCKHKSTSVKDSTYIGYTKHIKYFKMFMKVKCVDYNIHQFENWRKMMLKKKLSLRYKNDLIKFWKSILNYGANWYGFNFSSVYRKMERFSDPDAVKKEMQFYTYDEFKKFLSYEDDLMYRCLWQILYYCGLRRGEARGLQWNNIDFNKRTLSVTKQVLENPRSKTLPYQIIPP